MNLLKYSLCFAAVFCLLTGVVVAGDHALDCSKVCCKKAESEFPATLDCLRKQSPAIVPMQTSGTDEVFDYYTDPVNGHIYMVYVWDKDAVVYSNSLATGNKLYDGSEIMTIKPAGRSKGKVKLAQAAQVLRVRDGLESSSILKKGDVIAEFLPVPFFHDSLREGSEAKKLPSFGECFEGLWKSTGIYDICHQTFADFKNTWLLGLGRVLMMCVALVLIYLAIVKEFEPLLLLPIGFGALLANIPLAGIAAPGGIQWLIYNVGIESGVFPLLIFMGVGAMTDFGPMIANPKTALLGGAAQFGIFSALLGALALNVVPGIEFNIKDAASIGIIGGADGPTSIFLTSRLSPSLLGAIAVAAYSYMALVPIIQPPIMKALTTDAEKKIRMAQLRSVSKIEKVCFPILITLLCAFLLPDAAPLMGMLMFGNLMRECGVVQRLSDTAQNALCNIVTIFLGIAVGSKLSAEQFLSAQTLGILVLGCLAFCIGTAAGVLMARLMNVFSKDKINPLIGAAGVSAVPMAARVVNKVGLSYDSQNFLLMQAMGPNVSGVIGSAVAAGVLLKLCGGM